jgi:hypothetical protein
MTVRRLPMGSAPAAPVTYRPEPQPTGIALGDHPLGPLVVAPWAGSLMALGARLARRMPSPSDGQLVVALTVPVRDLAAVLVACGWMLTRPAKELGIPADVAATIAYGTPVSMVTDHYVIGGSFYGIQDGPTGPRIRAGGTWELEHVRGLAAVPDLGERRYGKRDITLPGTFAGKTGQSASWAARQCDPRRDLAILGTKSWLVDDMTACVGWGSAGLADEIGAILLPDTDTSPTWATRIYAAQLIQELNLPSDLSLVVLDGASAIRWLPVVESPVVVAVIDRRAADEAPSEMLMQVRARSGLESLATLGWQPSAGVEALAFRVAL